MVAIGANFLKGKSGIGRKRLPSGHVAFLDDQKSLCLAIRDLYAYAIQSCPVKPMQAVVFRVVGESEIHAINYKIQTLLGMDGFSANCRSFCPSAEQFHIIDSEHIAHAFNRHSDGGTERRHGHIPIGVRDFELIPEVVRPKYITEFSMRGNLPRIIYGREYGSEQLIVVQELRGNYGLTFKTVYRKK